MPAFYCILSILDADSRGEGRDGGEGERQREGQREARPRITDQILEIVLKSSYVISFVYGYRSHSRGGREGEGSRSRDEQEGV